MAGVVVHQRARSPGAAEGHEQPIAAIQGQHVPAELADAGHSPPGTETPHEALGAESLPRDEDDDKRGLREKNHVHLYTLSFDRHGHVLSLFQQTDSALRPFSNNVHAPEEEGDRPGEHGHGQEGGHHQPEQLGKKGQVVLAPSHQSTVWGTDIRENR